MIVRVANPERLDYEREEGRNFEFDVNAMQGEKLHACHATYLHSTLASISFSADLQVLSSVRVRVLVTDSNDNAPEFQVGDEGEYRFAVREDAEPGTEVGEKE